MDERHTPDPRNGESTGRPPSFPPPAGPVPGPGRSTGRDAGQPTGQDAGYGQGHVYGFDWQRPQEPTAAAPSSSPFGNAPGAGYGAGNPAPGQPAPAFAAAAPSQPARRRRQWPGVLTASLLAAVLASGGTALATGAFDSGSAAAGSGYSDLGSTTPVAASSSSDVEWQALASQVRDSVVAISVTTAEGSGAGSGVVVDAENGYIVTNNHVVGAATNGGIGVMLADGRIVEATIVGTDPTTDIAVIQLAEVPDDLQASPWGDSSEVLVGQDVMAVGNPLGLASTVTTGIVSAIDRPVSTTGEDASAAVVTNAIQIDAAINPGNSGGPLFSTSGEIIGINSSIATTSQASGSIGLGFAIPSDQARSVAEQLIADGEAEHAYLGVTLSDATATADDVTRSGAQVESVSNDTPAAEAGLRSGDVIVGINAKAVGGAEALTGFVRQYVAGDEVTLTVVRGGEALDVTVDLAARPVEETSAPQAPQQQAPQDGGSGSQLPQLPGLPWGGDNG